MLRPPFFGSLRNLWPGRGLFSTDLGKRIFLAVVLVVAVAIPLAIRVVPLGLETGKPSPRTVRAPRAIQYVDEQATNALRAAAAAAVGPVFVADSAGQSDARKRVVEFFSAVSSSRLSASEEATRQAEELGSRFASRIDTETMSAVVALSDESLATVARTTEALVASVMSGRILEGDVAKAREQLAQSAELIPLSLAERYAVIAVGEAFLVPTIVVDDAATAQARADAAERVAAVVTFIQEGENIVAKGDVVTAIDLDVVRALGGLEQGVTWKSVAASTGLLALLILASGAYIARYELKTWGRLRDLVLLGTLLVGMVYATRLVSLFAPEVSPYVMPAPLAAVLATLLLDARAGVLMTIQTAVAGLLLGFIGGAQVVSVIVVCMLAVAAVAHLSRRLELFYAGVFFTFTAGSVAAFSALASGAGFDQAAVIGAYGLAGGLLTAILTLGTLPFFEYVFGVTTDITLLELGTPSHPLLRRLMTEAPGTYSHSVLTANLAETAAEAIGASGVLARVGSYFHDVGKVERPGFFVENQAGAGNPHDVTEPGVSAEIITAHVTDGVALAEAHRLPAEVVDIVRQHHGTSLVTYFFDKATRAGADPAEEDYRYGGGRPTSREAALVMLADSAEAAVRALKAPSPERIAKTVRGVVSAKVADGQLDGSELTLADMERVVNVYSRMLASIYHPRIEYPVSAEEATTDASERDESPGP
jgi:hypothetical protein